MAENESKDANEQAKFSLLPANEAPQELALRATLPQKLHSLEAEAACLGIVFMRNDLCDSIFSEAPPSCFYDGRHRLIAEAIDSYRNEKGKASFDVIVIAEVLEKEDALVKAGGFRYLNRLIDAVPTPINFKDYTHIVKRKADLREIIDFSSEAIHKAKAGETPEAILDFLQQKNFALTSAESQNYEHIRPIVAKTLDFLEESLEQRKTLGILSRYQDLDNKIIGLQPSNLIIIGGQTGTGKTAFALSLLLQTALPQAGDKGISVGFFSLEMSKQDILFRMLSATSEVPLSEFRRGQPQDRHWKRILKAADSLAGTNIYLDDMPGITINELSTKMRLMVQKHHVNLIIVDYLQLITGSDQRSTREQQVSSISKQLKNLARQLSIPVIALTQLNRSPDQRDDKRPRLSDIRESGAIEQDADIVMLLHRPPTTEQQSMDDEMVETVTNLIIAKNRHGPTGNIKLVFEGEFVRFREYLE